MLRLDEEKVVHVLASCARVPRKAGRAFEEDDVEVLQPLDGSAAALGA